MKEFIKYIPKKPSRNIWRLHGAIPEKIQGRYSMKVLQKFLEKFLGGKPLSKVTMNAKQ